jgi:RNA polymerase sigma factor (sigma-70 family)
MPKNSLAGVLEYIRRIALAGSCQASDAGLLDRFARHGDESAFETLVAKHGPMVFGLCQRLLRHEQDAEDAFQATFLTLARKAGKISNKESLASWLYKVAYRSACRGRSGSQLLTNEMRALDRAGSEKEADVIWADLRSVLDQEIAGLAECYRRPIILCYLQGKSNADAARLLGCPKGTVVTHLARAREQLRRRLTRRGWTLSAGLLTTVLSEKAVAGALPGALARCTARSVLAYASGKVAGAGSVSEKVIVLSQGVLHMLWLDKIKMVAGVVLALVVVGAGIGLATRQTLAGGGSGGSQQVGNDPPNQNARIGAKAGGQDDSKAEIVILRSEIAKLRLELLKEIKSLKDSLRQGTAPQENDALYRDKPASFWLHKYRDADPKYRAEAIEALGHLARKNKELIPVIMTGFTDDFGDVVQKATESLMFFPDEVMTSEVIPRLVKIINDKSKSRGRWNAASALGQLGSFTTAVVPFLTQALEEQDLRSVAVSSLQNIGPGAKPAVPALVNLLGRSIQEFKVEGEKQAWWKLSRKDTNPPLPDMILLTLENIDPEIKNILPKVDKAASGYEDLVSLWQQGYEILKSHYSKKEK